MKVRPTTLPLLLSFLLAGCASASASAITIDWIIPFGQPSLPTVAAQVGDTLVFDWPANALPHNVLRQASSPTETCDFTGGDLLGDAGPVIYTLTEADGSSGEVVFTCTVPGHCLSGQVLTVTVAPGSTPPAADGSTSPASSGALPIAAALVGAGAVVASLLS
jgi:hypothetical protein